MNGKYWSLVASVGFAAVFHWPSPGLAATAPSLGSAQRFAVLGHSTVTNTNPTVINGNLGLSPGTSVTGFPPGIVTGGTIHVNDGVAAGAQSDASTAFNDMVAGLDQPCDMNFSGGTDLAGMTLTPGVYCSASSFLLNGTLTLDAQHVSSAVWIFKMASSTLTTGTNSVVTVINDGQPCNVFWRVGSSAVLGVGTTFIGTIIASASVTLDTGATVSGGRALALTGAVTLDTNHVDSNVCLAPAGGGCTTGDDCASGFCDSGTCAPCTSSTDCTGAGGTGTACVDNTCCTPTDTVNNCGGDCTPCATGSCTTGADCASGFCSGGTCTPCTTTGDCGGDLCVAGVCQVPAPPTLRKSFSPSVIHERREPTLIITLCNSNSIPANLTAPLIDTLPNGLVIDANPNASTTCPGTGAVAATAGGTTVTLPKTHSIPASDCCKVMVDVIPAGLSRGPFVNTLDKNALQTSNGSNAAAASATLTLNADVPMLSGWAMIMLIALLALVGFAAMRRQAMS